MSYKLKESLGYLTKSAGRSMANSLANDLQKSGVGVSYEQFVVLNWLWEGDGITQQELARLLSRDRANITRILDILERKGLVVRKSDPSDRRVKLVFLTELSSQLKEKVRAIVSRNIQNTVEGLDEEELETCKKILREIIKRL